MTMSRTSLAEVTLEYEVHGSGEPVVLIHPGHFSDWFSPLLGEPALSRFRLINYHRAGCAGSSRVAGALSLAGHAAHCRRLLESLDIPRAHVVGHSSSALVALQLALDSPETVQSLAVLEPAIMFVPSAARSRAPLMRAMELHRANDDPGAIDTFLQMVCGPGYRAVLDSALPDGFDQYVRDAGTFFDQEIPAIQAWSFTRDDASRVTQPVLAVAGEKSLETDETWRERQQLLLDWLPDVEPFVLPGASHFLQVQNPGDMAAALSAFFAKHTMAA